MVGPGCVVSYVAYCTAVAVGGGGDVVVVVLSYVGDST